MGMSLRPRVKAIGAGRAGAQTERGRSGHSAGAARVPLRYCRMNGRSLRAALLWLGAALLPAHAARAQEAAAANPVFTPPDTALFYEGREVYERNCVLCHGARGDGQGEMAKEVGVKPRSFRTGDFKFRSTPWGKLPTTEDLIRTIRQGVTGTTMGAFTQLTAAETRAVAEYV